jgi:hypothetical protein
MMGTTSSLGGFGTNNGVMTSDFQTVSGPLSAAIGSQRRPLALINN